MASSSTSAPIFIVDAFTATPFAGNPAAVCFYPWKPSSATGRFLKAESLVMQKVAAEMNLSETAFVVPDHSKNNDKELTIYNTAHFELRWFTPAGVEVNLCGHATLATAHAIFQEQSAKGTHFDALFFDTLSGILTVKRPTATTLQMNFPQGAPSSVTLPHDGVASLVQILPLGSQDNIVETQYCPSTKKLLIQVNHVDVIKNLNPDFAALQKVNYGASNVRGVIVTCQGDNQPYNFVSRYFAPWVGIPEDPVTGSAHTVLAVYWGGKLGKQDMIALQASARRGRVDIQLTSDGRVLLSGHAVTVLTGAIHL